MCGAPATTRGRRRSSIAEKVDEARALDRGRPRRAGGTCATGSPRRFPRCRTTRSSHRGRASSRRRSRRSSTAARSRRCCSACDGHAPRSAARPRVRRAAHARRRRQRAHQHAGELRRLRDAAGGERRGRADHGACARARWRRIGRTRHRHHQARIPDRRTSWRRSPTTSGASIPRAASTAASSLPRAAGRPHQRIHALVLADRPREPDPRAERDRRASRNRSRTACAAASASRSARRTRRAPICSIRRATRSSRRRC